MKKLSIYTLALIAIALLVPNISSASDKVEDYSKTIDVFSESPQVQPFLANSYGYAVFPSIGKGAFIIGGAFGKGQVYQAQKVTGFTKLIKASVGLQIGGKAFSQIIFFECHGFCRHY
jgi:lipid-binding SYLF domain-containing protein